jgi:hypothetical protein
MAKPRKNLHCSKLRFEALEGRMLLSAAPLANNVLVEVDLGTLVIRGDALANGLQIKGADGTYTVTGLVTADGQTTINGDPVNFVKTFTGVTHDVRIDMKGGDDLVSVGPDMPANPPLPPPAALPRDLFLDTGNGNDTVTLWDVNVTRNARVATGNGVDRVRMIYTSTGGNLIMNTGDAMDLAGIEGCSIGGALKVNTGTGIDSLALLYDKVFDKANVATGAGDDLLGIHGLEVVRRFGLDTGDGHDTVSVSKSGDDLITDLAAFADAHPGVSSTDLLYGWNFTHQPPEGMTEPAGSLSADYAVIVTGAGRDTLNLVSASPLGEASVSTGAGVDRVRIILSSISRSLTVNTGDAVDLGGIEGCFVGGDLAVNTGAGVDSLALLYDRVLGGAEVFTGIGDDLLGIHGLEVAGRLALDTGKGNDTVSVSKSGDDLMADLAAFANAHPWLSPTDLVYGWNFTHQPPPGIVEPAGSLSAENATLNTGLGNDSVRLVQTITAESLGVSLAQGKDSLIITDSTFGEAHLDGGPGVDTLTEARNTGQITVRRFEQTL